MRILYDHQIFILQEYGGVSRYFAELYKYIGNCDRDEAEIARKFSRNAYISKRRRKKWVNHNKILWNRYTISIYMNINRWIIEHNNKKYDIYHPTWVDPVLIDKFKGKTVVTIHDMVQELFQANDPRVISEIENKKQQIYRADKIIAISESTKRDILERYSDIDPNKIQVIYHGTNHLPQPLKPQFNTDKKYILYVGRRAEYKGSEFLLNVMSELVLENSDINIIFAGGGQFNVNEIDCIGRLGLTDRAEQHDVSDAEMAYLYQNAVCFVYPSCYEGFGMPLLEAFDNNCPVICTNSSSLPEVAGDAALYFEPLDGAGLLRQIKRFLYNENCRQDYIHKGMERVKQFTWEKAGQETLNLYGQLIKDSNIYDNR